MANQKMSKCFDSIREQLFAQHYFMNDDWLRDCLNYFLSEHNDADATEILSLIINQWLLSDLREISNERGCLPKNIQQHKHITLPGKYMLQIEKAYDVSISKYKQIEKIRNTTNKNVDVTDGERNDSQVPKSNRMMNLYLSDGIEDIIAMEYTKISSLDKIVPGYKVMINGPVDCRRGIILLEEKNIFMIGGEIESLLIDNAPENIFARALNLPVNPDPDIYITKLNDDGENLSDDHMDIDFEAVANIEKLNNTMKCLSASGSSNNPINKPHTISMTKTSDCIVSGENLMDTKKKEENLSIILDDADDEWFGMVDENNLDIVTTQPMQSAQLNGNVEQFTSDLEFCEFEMSDLTECDSTPPNTYNNLSKLHPIQASSINIKKSTINKSIKKSPVISTIRKNNDFATSIPKSSISMDNSTKLIPSSSERALKISGQHQKSKSKISNPKITEFLTKTNPKDKQLPMPISNYDSIHDVKKLIPTSKLIYKTVKATTKTLQKLTKRDNNWYLEGSVTDGINYIDVIFSSEVLDKLMGFTFNEFSQRKKLQKTNPKIKDELRLTLRNTESVLIRMDAVLKLELIPNETKVKIISIT